MHVVMIKACNIMINNGDAHRLYMLLSSPPPSPSLSPSLSGKGYTLDRLGQGRAREGKGHMDVLSLTESILF